MQREAVMSKESISNQDSRLRQVLILLTGGACSADLFVHTNTGKMKSHEEVSTAVLDLSNSYRMQHGYWGSKTKMVIRYMENKFQKAGALWHVMKVGAAILALMGSVRMIENFEKSTSGWKNSSERMKKVSLRKKKKKETVETLAQIDSDEDSDDDNEKDKGKKIPQTSKAFKGLNQKHIKHTINKWYKRGKYGTILTALLSVGAEVSHMKAFNPIRVILEDGTSAITKFRSAQLVNAVFTDGISSENIANMKKVAREITELDHSIEKMKVGGVVPLQSIRDMIKHFQKKEGRIMNAIVGKNCKQKIGQLFDSTVHNKVAHSRSSFIREMIHLCGSQHIYAYYFLNSYGDRRDTVIEIMAAYLVVYQKNKRSLKDFNERLFPKVASKTSIKDAKYKQKYAKRQSVKKVTEPKDDGENLQESQKEDKPSYIERIIHKYKIVIFSKNYCPYCQTVKAIFKNQIKDGTCKVVELNALKGNKGKILQKELKRITGQSTVPNVFINGEHKGGSKEILMLQAEQKLPFFY